MQTILDYLDWRGDLSFSTSPFNEVDNLILSELVYLELDGIVGGLESDDFPTLAQTQKELERRGVKPSSPINNPHILASKAAETDRYRDVRLAWYQSNIDTARQVQYGAVTFFLPDGTVYVAFRGTDSTIVGWREDFNLWYSDSTPGQDHALAYLDAVAGKTQGDLTVGGHSKGGNLAIYAAAFGPYRVRERVRVVYSNDGPGFNKKIIATPQYHAVLPKVRHIIPESSLIGILMANTPIKTIVKSTASGVQQHDPYTWAVLGTSFELADELSSISLFANDTFNRWFTTMDEDSRRTVVNAVFDSWEASGATTVSEFRSMNPSAYAAILKNVADLDADTKREVMDSVGKLFEAGARTFAEGAKNRTKAALEQHVASRIQTSRVQMPALEHQRPQS
ncbi:Mbeg1-like protein [Slackia heliotrinireducens]|uniref:Mbeg1-like protein n=1 Tax=Slackia heliotrinireducens TaxID=84110 RepID=UPI0033152F2C